MVRGVLLLACFAAVAVDAKETDKLVSETEDLIAKVMGGHKMPQHEVKMHQAAKPAPSEFAVDMSKPAPSAHLLSGHGHGSMMHHHGQQLDLGAEMRFRARKVMLRQRNTAAQMALQQQQMMMATMRQQQQMIMQMQKQMQAMAQARGQPAAAAPGLQQYGHRAFDGFGSGIPISDRYPSVTGIGAKMQFRATQAKLLRKKAAEEAARKAADQRAALAAVQGMQNGALDPTLPAAGTVVTPMSTAERVARNQGIIFGNAYRHSRDTFDGPPRFQELKGGLSGAPDGVPPPKASAPAAPAAMRFRATGASLVPSDSIPAPRQDDTASLMTPQHLAVGEEQQLLASPDAGASLLSNLDKPPPTSSSFMEVSAHAGAHAQTTSKAKAAAKAKAKATTARIGDGLPVSGPDHHTGADTGLIQEASTEGTAAAVAAAAGGLGDDIDYGYGHHSFEQDEQDEDSAASKESSAENEAMSSMRFATKKAEMSRVGSASGLVSTPAVGALAAYNKDAEIEKAMEWENEHPVTASRSSGGKHAAHKSKHHRHQKPSVGENARFAEVDASAEESHPTARAASVPASDMEGLQNSYENKRRAMHGEQALPQAALEQSAGDTPGPEPGPPRFVSTSEELIRVGTKHGHAMSQSENLVEQTRESLFGEDAEGDAVEDTDAREVTAGSGTPESATAPAAASSPPLQGEVSAFYKKHLSAATAAQLPRFAEKGRALPVLSSSLGDDLHQAAASIPRSHHAFKSLSRSLSTAHAGLGVSSTARASVKAGGIISANKPYEEDPIPNPTDADKAEAANYGKPQYDNTKAGARERRRLSRGSLGDGAHAGILHAASHSQSTMHARESSSKFADQARRMRFRELVFGRTGKLMQRADRLRRHAKFSLPAPHWHGWVEKAQVERRDRR